MKRLTKAAEVGLSADGGHFVLETDASNVELSDALRVENS